MPEFLKTIKKFLVILGITVNITEPCIRHKVFIFENPVLLKKYVQKKLIKFEID